MTFLAVVSSQLPSSSIGLSSVLCKFSHIFFIRVLPPPLDGVTRGGPPPPPSDAAVSIGVARGALGARVTPRAEKKWGD